MVRFAFRKSIFLQRGGYCWICWVTAALTCGGCRLIPTAPPPPPPYTVRAGVALSSATQRTLLLLPPYVHRGDAEAGPMVAEALTGALTEAGFLVSTTAPGELGSWSGGRSADASLLAEMAQQAGVDLLMAVDVTEYRPYEPPRLGLVVRVYMPGNPEPVWELRGTWDYREQRVARRMEVYVQHELQETAPRVGHEAILRSPTEFVRFVAHEVVSAMAPPVEAPPQALPLWRRAAQALDLEL
jgi:hypothetical protein